MCMGMLFRLKKIHDHICASLQQQAEVPPFCTCDLKPRPVSVTTLILRDVPQK